MKYFGSVFVLLWFLCSVAEAECLLSGTYRGNAQKTLEVVYAQRHIESDDEREGLMELFGSVKHEWRCTEMRAWNRERLAVD